MAASSSQTWNLQKPGRDRTKDGASMGVNFTEWSKSAESEALEPLEEYPWKSKQDAFEQSVGQEQQNI